jgi:hypothetical protein
MLEAAWSALTHIFAPLPFLALMLDTYLGLNGTHVHALPPRTPENLANAIKRGQDYVKTLPAETIAIMGKMYAGGN